MTICMIRIFLSFPIFMIRYNLLLFARSSGKGHLQNGIFLLSILFIFCTLAYIDQSIYETLLFQMPGVVFLADYASIKITRLCDAAFFATLPLSMSEKFRLLIIQKLASNALIPLLLYLTIYIVHFNFSYLHIINVTLIYLASLLISVATIHNACRIHSGDKFCCRLGTISFFLPIMLFQLFQLSGASSADVRFMMSFCSKYEWHIFFLASFLLLISGIVAYLSWRRIVQNKPWCCHEKFL